MARQCGVTGKKAATGNNVSHANNRTRRRFLPNIQKASFPSEILGRSIQLKVSTNGIRTIEHNGGIDNYLLTTPARKMSAEVVKLKKMITKRAAAQQK